MYDQKNVIFIVLDSLRKDRLSVYNDDIDFTENLQEIADESIVFEDAVAQANWSLPSHASMFTGRYPWEHGATHQRAYFKGEKELFVRKFKEEGYRTACITTNPWITPHKNMTDDFDYVQNFLGKADNVLVTKISRMAAKFLDNRSNTVKRSITRVVDRSFEFLNLNDACKTEEIVSEARKYIDNVDEDERFFLFMNIMEPHEPYNPPEKYSEAHGLEDTGSIPNSQKDVIEGKDDFENLRRVYDASVDYTDDVLGRLMEHLRDNGLKDETVVIIVSDHGQALGEEGMFGHQFNVMEPVINTVMMVDRPGREADRRPQMVELRKLAELVPYYAGIGEEPEEIHPEYVRGGVEFPDAPGSLGQIPESDWDRYYRKFRYVKKDGKKIVKSKTEDGRTSYKMYDLESGEEIEVEEEFKREVDKISDVDVEPGEQREEDEEVKKRLEDLGYM